MADIQEKRAMDDSPDDGPGVLPSKGANVGDLDVEGRVSSGGYDSDEPIHKDAQIGVQNIEAIASAWTRTALIAAYVMIWIIYFVDSMQQGSTGLLTPYVTSAFQNHSLTPTVQILSSIIGGIFKLTLAKIVDVFGRPQGYFLCIVLTTMGLVMMAACQNVETYAAAQVFYWVGFNGLGYCLSIFIADTSALKNRGLMFAYSNSPYIITTWLSGPISEAFLKGPGFRWGFGSFAIITPVVTLPLFGLFMQNYYKAKRMGIVPDRSSNRTAAQSVLYYLKEFDAVGILLLSAGLALFLLPFNLYTMQSEGWRSPLIICFLVFGVVLIFAFVAWEKWFAPVQFIPYSLLLDRTVIGACILAATAFFSFYSWDAYFTSFLQVVQNLSITKTSYVANIYSIGSCFWAIVVGLWIRYTGRFKPICLYFGVPLTILGVGLMLKFRQPDENIGFIVMCQIFIAFAGGTIVICEQTAIMAATSHQYVAVVIAIEHMFSNIGGAVGLTVAGAIWQSVFPEALAKYLPESEQGNLTVIYGDLNTQLSYPVGTPARAAIQRAYGDAQKMMLIASVAFLAIALVATAVWRDINVKEHKQVKGRVI